MLTLVLRRLFSSLQMLELTESLRVQAVIPRWTAVAVRSAESLAHRNAQTETRMPEPFPGLKTTHSLIAPTLTELESLWRVV